MVLGDIPPLAFLAAAQAGVPGVGMSNFSWDWIYAHLARQEPGLSAAAAAAAAAYAQATNLLRASVRRRPLRLPPPDGGASRRAPAVA